MSSGTTNLAYLPEASIISRLSDAKCQGKLKDRVGPALALWVTAWLSVWLWAAVAFGITAAKGDPFNSDDNSPSISQTGWPGHDVDGYECDFVDTDIDDLCPANPGF